jgi:hypothetical protein
MFYLSLFLSLSLSFSLSHSLREKKKKKKKENGVRISLSLALSPSYGARFAIGGITEHVFSSLFAKRSLAAIEKKTSFLSSSHVLINYLNLI